MGYAAVVVYVVKERWIQNSVGKHEVQRLRGRDRHRWEENIKINLHAVR
jgi:hypothetical protein